MSLTGYKTKIIEVSWIDKDTLKKIQLYLKGLVECWDKNNKGKWFRARDLIGGDNKNWCDTPLQKLYEHYKDKGEEYAYKQAAIDAGKILKQTLYKSRMRTYETKLDGNQVRVYIWRPN